MQQKNNYHLAIDIGASSGRHILGYEENGILKTEEIYRFQNGPVEKAGTAGALGATGAKRLTWDAARLYSEILNGLKRAKELGKIPATVGIDTWGVDYVLLDENDEVIGDVYAYRDGRTKTPFLPCTNAFRSRNCIGKRASSSRSTTPCTSCTTTCARARRNARLRI